MKANLFIDSNTFKYINDTHQQEVIKKIIDFSELLECISTNYEDEVFVNNIDFYTTEILPSVTLNDFLFVNSNEYECKDVIDLLLRLLTSFQDNNCDEETVLNIINDNNSCSGLIVLNKQNNIGVINEKQILSTKQDWFDFHRNYLIKQPCETTKDFLKDVRKYFIRLYIHPDNEEYIKKIYKTHLKRIIQYLSLMNDKMIDEFKNDARYHNDFVSFLAWFKTAHSEIDDASFQGNFKNHHEKKEFEKEFEINGEKKKFLCEPHLKMFRDDYGKNSHGRIYFKALKFEDSFIYIGLITNHI